MAQKPPKFKTESERYNYAKDKAKEALSMFSLEEIERCGEAQLLSDLESQALIRMPVSQDMKSTMKPYEI